MFVNELKEIQLPSPDHCLLIYDQVLDSNPDFKDWSKTYFKKYAVKAGEELKDLENFTGHVLKLSQIAGQVARLKFTVVAVGGGSVGDFSGFFASVFKRGVNFINIPSTWLSAIDSAHGGKTALNVGGFKNQVGSFYEANEVFVCKSLLKGLSPDQLKYGQSELLKMALVGGEDLFAKLDGDYTDFEFLWGQLPAAVEEKMKVVREDPTERHGKREVLNLGHTLGHVLESDFGLPHGLAIAHGLVFALLWSEEMEFLPSDVLSRIKPKFDMIFGKDFFEQRLPVETDKLRRFVAQDKKMQSTDRLRFIFLRDIGDVFTEDVSLEEFVAEAHRQGWCQ